MRARRLRSPRRRVSERARRLGPSLRIHVMEDEATRTSARSPQPRSAAELLLDSVTDIALLTLDRGGVIRSWNRGAENVNGWAADEIIGRHFSAMYPDEDVVA